MSQLVRTASALIGVCAAIACLLGWASPAAAGDAAFTSAGELTFGPNATPGPVAVGDFDADGRQDLAILDFQGSCLHVRLGNGDGTFRDAGKIGDLGGPLAVAVGDFDADGNDDLAVAAAVAVTGEIGVLRGAGNGTFAQMTAVDLPNPAYSLAIGDFNGDGKEDLAATTLASVSTRLGKGDGTFAGGVDVAFDPTPSSLAAGDFDGNGTEDLAVILDTSLTRLGVLPGKGNGAFDPVKTVRIPNFAQRLAVGDFDADGREDLAAPIPAHDRVSVRLGRGDGTLRDDPPDVAVGDEPFAPAVADFDSDGSEDLVITNSGGASSGSSVSVRLGNGDGSFRDGGEVAAGDAPVSVAVGDFDADGKEDLAVANYSGGTVSVRLGSGAAPLAGNLLANGGFEQGLGARLPTQSPAVPGWTRTGGMTFVRYGVVPHLVFPSRLDAPRYTTGGLNFLWGGDSTGLGGVTTATQTVDVSASAGPVDAGRATVGLSAYLGGAQSYPDRMHATAEFLDATGAALGVLQVGPVTNADRRNLTTLLRRENSAAAPVGTRRIRVTLTSTDTDTISSAMADNVKLTLAAPAAAPTPAGGPASSRTSATRPAFGANTGVTIKLAASRIAARGPVRVLLANANAFAVSGTLAGRTATAIGAGRKALKLTAKRFAVAARGRSTVELALSRALRRELLRRRKLVLRLSVVVLDPAGNRRIVRHQVAPRLKAPRPGARPRVQQLA